MTGKDTEDRVFESVAELFAVLSTPIRLKIISAVCHGEKNVSELLAEIDTTQPNMSQHLSTPYRCGVLAKRRDGVQMYYRLQSERVATLCRAREITLFGKGQKIFQPVQLHGSSSLRPRPAPQRHLCRYGIRRNRIGI